MGPTDLPTPDEIIATHEEIEEQYDLKYRGARIAAPTLVLRRLLEEAEKLSGKYQQAAFLLRKLITEHIFEDGNKRTAWVTTREYLQSVDRRPAETGDRVPRILRRIRRYEIEEIAEWLETGEIDEDRLYP